jgi:hypothetical protein
MSKRGGAMIVVVSWPIFVLDFDFDIERDFEIGVGICS